MNDTVAGTPAADTVRRPESGGGANGSGGAGGVDINEAVAPPTGAYTPVEENYNPEPRRDQARMWLAYILVALLCVVIMASYGSLWLMSSADFPNLKALLELVLAPVIALVGSATGFYFGGGGSGRSGR